jgi:hypothetical protein
MKSSTSSESLLDLRMFVGNVGDEQPYQSLFSLLLDIETGCVRRQGAILSFKPVCEDPKHSKRAKNLCR